MFLGGFLGFFHFVACFDPLSNPFCTFLEKSGFDLAKFSSPEKYKSCQFHCPAVPGALVYVGMMK